MWAPLSLFAALALASVVSAGSFHTFQKRDLPGAKASEVVEHHYIIQYEDHIRHSDTYALLQKRNIEYDVHHEYNVFNGLALRLRSDHDGHVLATIPGIKHVWPATVTHLPEVQKRSFHPLANPTSGVASLLRKRGIVSPSEDVSLHSMTGVDILQGKYKLSGKGIKVGVIDSGLDYRHPVFAMPGAKQGCLGPGCRITHGYDFVGKNYNGTRESVSPDSDPMDCLGHGTHVAGVIGGNGMDPSLNPKPPRPFIGVAPDVTFGAYKIGGCDTPIDLMAALAAMEQAATDGMDIINMSFGLTPSFSTNPFGEMADRLAKRGVISVGSAGNSGEDGVMMVEDNGLGLESTSVGSFNNKVVYINTLVYGDSTDLPYVPAMSWDQPFQFEQPVTLVPLLDNDVLADGCKQELYEKLPEMSNKILLTVFEYTGPCSPSQRAEYAKAKGAVGVLTVGPFDELIETYNATPGFPMAMLPRYASDVLLQTYKKSPSTLFSWNDNKVAFALPGSASPSFFSSLGLAGNLNLKPDISAPGANILSSWSLDRGAYLVASGTSMSSPYIAGAYALYIQAKGTKPPASVVRRAFKNTAKIWQNATSNSYTSAARQGSGFISAVDAVLTTSSISPDHINLLDTAHHQGSVEITISNNARFPETYTLSHIPAEALNSYPNGNTFPLGKPVVEQDDAIVQFPVNKVTIPAGQRRRIRIRISQPTSGNPSTFPLYSGFIVATPATQGASVVHVPYAGIKGDVSKLPIMDTKGGYPSLKLLNPSKEVVPIPGNGGNHLFHLAKEKPIVLTRLGSHTLDGQIRIHHAITKAFVGFLVDVDGLVAQGIFGRTSNSMGESGVKRWVWGGKCVVDGKASTKAVQVPPGAYSIVVASRRQLTKGRYPNDFEVFHLGTVVLA